MPPHELRHLAFHYRHGRPRHAAAIANVRTFADLTECMLQHRPPDTVRELVVAFFEGRRLARGIFGEGSEFAASVPSVAGVMTVGEERPGFEST